VFVPETAVPSPGSRFKPRAMEIFRAKVEALDFNSPKAVDAVNGWVKKATNEQVPSIIEKLEPDGRFVLLNAIYFNGAWKLAFDPARTAKAPFTRADKTTREVSMMSATFPVALAELGSLQVAWLPYDGDDVAMVLIAPRAKEAPTAVADALRKTSIDDLIAAARKEARERPVHVRLPRFRAESLLDLTDTLASQIGPALAANSDYGPINNAKRGPLQVIHRAVLEVTETGTVAAAATAVTSDRSLAVTPVISADRPFAFAIVHRPTQAVLFTGYVADPGDAPATEPTR
jgi:serpin B